MTTTILKDFNGQSQQIRSMINKRGRRQGQIFNQDQINDFEQTVWLKVLKDPQNRLNPAYLASIVRSVIIDSATRQRYHFTENILAQLMSANRLNATTTTYLTELAEKSEEHYQEAFKQYLDDCLEAEPLAVLLKDKILKLALKNKRTHVSLTREDGEWDLPDPFSDRHQEDIETQLLLTELKKELQLMLTAQEWTILELVLIQGLTQVNVAHVLGLSNGRICQVVKKTKAKIRKVLNAKEWLL